jgi:hypothetical protein
MSSARCPNCEAELDAVDLASGWCDRCGKKIPDFARSTGISPTRRDAPRLAASDPERPPLRSGYRQPNYALRGLVALGMVVIIVAGIGLYFWLKHDVEITVDNGGSEPVTVFVDGSQELTVPAGEKKVFTCRSGQRKITVRRGERTVVDESRRLEGKGHRGESRKYLLNPEADNRYWVRTVQYGTVLPTLSPFVRGDADRYRRAANEIKLVPVGAWVDVNPDFILQEPPMAVQGTISDDRSVVSRITREDYDLIAAAATKENISSSDAGAMELLVDRLLKFGK